MLAETRARWEKELRPLLSGLDPARPQLAHAALRRYELLAPAQVARLDRIVSLFDQDVAEDTYRLAIIQATLWGCPCCSE